MSRRQKPKNRMDRFLLKDKLSRYEKKFGVYQRQKKIVEENKEAIIAGELNITDLPEFPHDELNTGVTALDYKDVYINHRILINIFLESSLMYLFIEHNQLEMLRTILNASPDLANVNWQVHEKKSVKLDRHYSPPLREVKNCLYADYGTSYRYEAYDEIVPIEWKNLLSIAAQFGHVAILTALIDDYHCEVVVDSDHALTAKGSDDVEYKADFPNPCQVAIKYDQVDIVRELTLRYPEFLSFKYLKEAMTKGKKYGNRKVARYYIEHIDQLEEQLDRKELMKFVRLSTGRLGDIFDYMINLLNDRYPGAVDVFLSDYLKGINISADKVLRLIKHVIEELKLDVDETSFLAKATRKGTGNRWNEEQLYNLMHYLVFERNADPYKANLESMRRRGSRSVSNILAKYARYRNHVRLTSCFKITLFATAVGAAAVATKLVHNAVKNYYSS